MLVSFDPHLGTACPQLCRSEVYASFAFNKSSIMKYLLCIATLPNQASNEGFPNLSSELSEEEVGKCRIFDP
eukprot:c23532_g2_i4 orf=484-699(+)